MKAYSTQYERNIERLKQAYPDISEAQFEEFDELNSGVYLLIKINHDNLEEVVYVGISSNLAQRIATHRCERKKIFEKVYIHKCKEYWKAAMIESHLINKYNPLYNISKGVLADALYRNQHGMKLSNNVENFAVPTGWVQTATIEAKQNTNKYESIR
jgi:hypothetical protein